jgi:hypothetical protein
MKRATAKAQELDPDLVVSKGLWGYYATSKKYRRQAGTPVRRYVDQVLTDLRAGMRPRELAKGEPL